MVCAQENVVLPEPSLRFTKSACSTKNTFPRRSGLTFAFWRLAALCQNHGRDWELAFEH